MTSGSREITRDFDDIIGDLWFVLKTIKGMESDLLGKKLDTTLQLVHMDVLEHGELTQETLDVLNATRFEILNFAKRFVERHDDQY